MAQGTTVILVPARYHPGPQGAIASYVGEKRQAAAYYLANRDLQTITWAVVSEFRGDIEVQASLVTDPTTDGDWFRVYQINAVNNNYGFHNLQGNFVWLRSIVSNWTQGAVQQVTASY
jgi:hypothetical protein